MASDGEALTELCLEDWWWVTKNQQHDNGTPDSELEVFRITRDWLQAYFADERPSLSQAPPMNPAGTPFQHEVWQLVAEIPYGMTASYGEIAAVEGVWLRKRLEARSSTIQSPSSCLATAWSDQAARLAAMAAGSTSRPNCSSTRAWI